MVQASSCIWSSVPCLNIISKARVGIAGVLISVRFIGSWAFGEDLWGYVRGGGVTIGAAVVEVVIWYTREVKLGAVELDDLDDVELREIELDDVLERSLSSESGGKGVQVSGSMIGGSSGLLEYVKPGGDVELRPPSSPPRYGGKLAPRCRMLRGRVGDLERIRVSKSSMVVVELLTDSDLGCILL